jgi:hypothetical protein
MQHDLATLMDPIPLPERAGDRDEARQLVEDALPSRFVGAAIELDGSRLVAVAPSFVDELVKAILVDGEASRLVMWNLSSRATDFAASAAQRRGVFERLDLRPPPR